MQTTTPATPGIPFSHWWGIFGCMLLLGVVWMAGPYSDDLVFAPDQGSSWYYWKLTEPTLWTRLSAWGGYLAHQLTMWAIIYYAIRQQAGYSSSLHRFNWLAMAVNAFFILLHVVQTRVFYDGLAQDVSIYTSFASVVLMLWVVMIMENRRRGLFFGKPLTVLYGLGDVLKHYHGYYISWAIIYTFWYHPIELTSGHLFGLLYIFLLMLQGSLFFTRFHTNRWWTVLLESFFAIHGFVVAYFVSQSGISSALLFFMGGVGIFVITQVYGLPLRSLHRRIIIMLGFIGMAAFALFSESQPERILQMTLLLYLGVLMFAFILWVLMKLMLLVAARSA